MNAPGPGNSRSDRWTWKLVSPPRPGAVAIFDCTGDLESAFHTLGFQSLPVGNVAIRTIPNIDSTLVARFSSTFMQVMPHGGPAVVHALLSLLAANAAEASNPDYPEAASAIEEEMLRALARAASPAAIDLLLEQPARWARAFPNLAPHQLPDGEPEPRDLLLRHLISPPLVVAWGGANIGKSSLCNALAHREASIVADEPGTTRDHVGVLLELDGLTVRYVDTPGVRNTPDPIEREAAAAAADLASAADLFLLCGDPSTPPPSPPTSGRPPAPSLTVCLRRDLGPPTWHPEISTAAKLGVGLDELARTIRERLVPHTLLNADRPWRFWGGHGAAAADSARSAAHSRGPGAS
jgi:tRNA modification GTPase